MAAVTAKYYFRFRICWCHCLQKIYQQTKFCRYISIGGWDIASFGFEKQTSAILKLYFRFQCRPFRRNRRVVLHRAAEFRPNRNIHCRNMTSYRQPCCVCFAVMSDQTRSAFRGLNWVLEPQVRRFNSSGNIAINRFRSFGFKLPIHAPFWRSFWTYFPHMCIGLTWAQDREKKDSITKKVTKVLYFPYLGGSPYWADSTQKLHGGWCLRRNHVCQVSNWNLLGLQFYRPSSFGFSYWFFKMAISWSYRWIMCSTG